MGMSLAASLYNGHRTFSMSACVFANTVRSSAVHIFRLHLHALHQLVGTHDFASTPFDQCDR
jgi:hypothetical protein